jgi:hypothetical protein
MKRMALQFALPCIIWAQASTPGQPYPPGAISDVNYQTIQAGCNAAGNGTYIWSKPWGRLATQVFNCNISARSGGSIQPAGGQTITINGAFEGDLTQHFDLSAGGRVVFGAHTSLLRTEWFGAKWDGMTDDTAAWANTIASCPSAGCEIHLPENATSYTAAGIVVNNLNSSQYIRIIGAGSSSRIRCTGVICVSWTGTAAQSSGMEKLMISDPVGNNSTVGIYIFGGLEGCCAQNRITLTDVDVEGNSDLQNRLSPPVWHGLGIGIYAHNTVLPIFNKVKVRYFNEGLRTNGANVWATNLMLMANGSYGWNDVSSTDSYCLQCDIEENTVYGLNKNGGTYNGSFISTHWEANGADFHLFNGALLTSIGSTFIGSTGHSLVESGSVFKSVDDYLAISITNNSAGNKGLGPGVTTSGAGCCVPVTGTGWTQEYGPDGLREFNNPNRGPHAFSGGPAQGYTFDQMVYGTRGFADDGPAFTLGANPCGATVSPASGATRGIVNSGTTGPCTVTLNLPAAPHSWNCLANNQSAASAGSPRPFEQTGRAANACTMSGTTTANDEIAITAFPF